jgi:hypothetical protein
MPELPIGTVHFDNSMPLRLQKTRKTRSIRSICQSASLSSSSSPSLQQQARFDAFVHEFNVERPHEALSMKCPAEIYSVSPRPYEGLPDIACPFHNSDILVTACGRICMHRKKITISTVLVGQRLGINEVNDGIWRVSFMPYDLGTFDLEQRTSRPLDNPFGPRLSRLSWVRSVTYVLGLDTKILEQAKGFEPSSPNLGKGTDLSAVPQTLRACLKRVLRSGWLHDSGHQFQLMR